MQEAEVKKIISYLATKEKIEKIDQKIDYLQTLMYEARRQFSLKDLDVINEDVLKVQHKIEKLENLKKELTNKLKEIAPEYYKLIDLAQKIESFFMKKREDILNGDINFDEFKSNLKNIFDRITQLDEMLEREKEELSHLLKSNISEPIHNRILREIESIEEKINTLKKIKNILNPNIDNLKKAYRYIGEKIYIVGEKEITGTITDVYIRKRDFKILLEISKEKNLDENTLELLLRELGVELGVKNSEELLSLLQKETSASDSDLLTATTILEVLKKLDLSIPTKIERALIPKYERLGFVAIDDLKSINHQRQKKIRSIVNYSSLISPNEAAFKAPSIIRIPTEYYSKIIRIFGYRYTIYTESIVPDVGYVLILLRRDEKNEPLPDSNFLRRFLKAIRSIRPKIFENFGIVANIEKLSTDDVYWITRLLVVKGLADQQDVTESTALRPHLLFAFCLKYGIPMLYEEIIQSYFSLIESYNLSIREARLAFRIRKQPYPLTKYFNKRKLMYLLPEDCSDIIGITVKKDRIILHCCRPLDDEKFNSIIESYKIPSKIIMSLDKHPKKIMRAIILSQKVRTPEEYSLLKKKVNIFTINYDDVLKIEKSQDIFIRVLLKFF